MNRISVFFCSLCMVGLTIPVLGFGPYRTIEKMAGKFEAATGLKMDVMDGSGDCILFIQRPLENGAIDEWEARASDFLKICKTRNPVGGVYPVTVELKEGRTWLYSQTPKPPEDRTDGKGKPFPQLSGKAEEDARGIKVALEYIISSCLAPTRAFPVHGLAEPCGSFEK